MASFLSAVGLVFVIEGLLYALVPGQMKRVMAEAMRTHEDKLRLAGVAAMAAGVGLVWISHPG